jgi:hypothetical protein
VYAEVHIDITCRQIIVGVPAWLHLSSVIQAVTVSIHVEESNRKEGPTARFFKTACGDGQKWYSSIDIYLDGQGSAGSEVLQVSPLSNSRDDIIAPPEMNYLRSNVFLLR